MNLFAPFNSDGYKLAHAEMYSDGTTLVNANNTPRNDRIYRRQATKYYDGKIVVIGQEGALQEVVENWQKFFDMDKGIAIARFKMLCDNYLGMDAVPTHRLAALHDLGYLPLKIKTVDEGTKMGFNIPVMTIENTVPHAFWLVNFLETTLSNLMWKPSTVATIACEYKRMLLDYAEQTGVDLNTVLFQGHSFACRGMSGPEDSARSEFGHIAAFLGTDSLGSIMYAQDYYRAGEFVAASVPATEHAVATSNILRIERELGNGDYRFHSEEQVRIEGDMRKNGEDRRLIAEMMFLYELMLKFPKGILSYVADSYDFWGVLSRGLPYMKEVILRRESNGITPGRLVLRPDTGVPERVVNGYFVYPEGYNDLYNMSNAEESAVVKQGDKFYRYEVEYDGFGGESWPERYVLREEVSAEEVRGAARLLQDIFGYELTEKGYLQYVDQIGLIYGDSITPKRCLDILEGLKQNGLASSCCVFGIGSYTYQCLTRDVFGFTVKATYTEVNGEKISIFKDPKTDSKKKSAKGLLAVVVGEGGELELLNDVTREFEESDTNMLKLRFLDGNFMNLSTLGQIRTKLERG